MSSVCDPWQSPEEHYGITRQCLEMLRESGHSLFLQTKCELALRDFDLLEGRSDVEFGVTVTSTNAGVARVVEPNASEPELRLQMIREARRIGLRTFVFLGPLLPGLSDRGDGLDHLFHAVAQVQPDRVFVDRLNRRAGMWPAVASAASTLDPALPSEYKRVLFSSESSLYSAVLRERVAKVAESHGLLKRIEWCFE